ncbi:ATP-binding protein [Catellatospora vulcania]|uniref:ATP-binding protein n=1 Tax=Catellatospora vulcania TaxID=1460450 RepID=UPI0012D4A7C1|nr:AAA family ATPase [Catellatospora vulcania]
MPLFVGRQDALSQLSAALAATGGTGWRRPALVLVSGEAGIGKTALLTRFTADAATAGARTAWGTCWNGEQAPAYWPWTQVLRCLDDPDPQPAPTVAATGLLDTPPPGGDAAAGRLRVFDTVARTLAAAVRPGPVVVVLDDLQWTDDASLELLRFLTGMTYPGALLLLAAYRPDELARPAATTMADLALPAERIPLRGLSPQEVSDLVHAVAGPTAAGRWAPVVHERSGGHPFFAGELSRLLSDGPPVGVVPAAVREVIARRTSRLSADCARLVEAAAVGTGTLLPDVLAEVTGQPPARVAELTEQATAAGILTGTADGTRFTHDLYRESIYSGLSTAQRLDLHGRLAGALQRRHERGATVFAAEIAHHCTAALPHTIDAALLWARRAAQADADRYAFTDAAAHLARVRAAAAATGAALSDTDHVDLLTTEADHRLRAGDPTPARDLLDTAWQRARHTREPELIGAVALGIDRIGARFAMPRTDLVSRLEQARHALDGTATATEAQVTAALARQLQHSIPADRHRAAPLAEHAITVARRLADPATLAGCLLAQHDVLWTPGTATRRAQIATEIGELSRQAHDPESQAQALLLTATAQLETADPAFRATLHAYDHAARQLRQPRHDYNLHIRRAALALLDGDLSAGEQLSAHAAALGEAVGDADTGNVRMSQRLEIVRARGDAAQLRDTAAEAVSWWIGAPAHAHAVAAGFYARAGDHDLARRELDTVLALPDWRTDRSYLWSVFVGELATAAVALDDRPLCRQLLGDLLPLSQTCAVNAALVAFMGAHAHRIGSLHAALGEHAPARQWLGRAAELHRRLGARGWQAESHAAIAALDTRPGKRLPPARRHDGEVALHRVGDMWQAGYHGQTAFLRDCKGLHDLAALLAAPGVDHPALTLAGAATAGADRADPALDRTALAAYRRRLAALDQELADADDDLDLGRRHAAADEREQLLTQLRQATRPDGHSRPLGASAAERARKAVTARIRDAITRIREALPELAAHLDRTVRTGNTCRYDPR